MKIAGCQILILAKRTWEFLKIIQKSFCFFVLIINIVREKFVIKLCRVIAAGGSCDTGLDNLFKKQCFLIYIEKVRC